MIDWAVLGLMATTILGYTLFWIQVRRWRKLMEETNRLVRVNAMLRAKLKKERDPR